MGEDEGRWTVGAGDKCMRCEKMVVAACLDHEFKGCEEHMADHDKQCGRDEGMTPEGIVASISVPAPFGGRLYVPAGLVTAIAATLRSFGEQERRRARAEALEEAARIASAATADPESRLIHPDIPFKRFAESARNMAHATAQAIAGELRALAEQPPPKEQEHE